MAIGLDPLIQYVVEGKNGAYQVLSAAYDPKKDEFFDVFNNEPRAPGDWGHWLSGGMNWNSNCAYCHTTDFRKNFKVGDNSYHSGFSAHGVSCLQCHDAFRRTANIRSFPSLPKGRRPRRECTPVLYAIPAENSSKTKNLRPEAIFTTISARYFPCRTEYITQTAKCETKILCFRRL